MIDVSGIETLQGKNRSSRMTEHDSMNWGCIDFTGKEALMKVEIFTGENYFLGNASCFLIVIIFQIIT